jgi:hypothetical protein
MRRIRTGWYAHYATIRQDWSGDVHLELEFRGWMHIAYRIGQAARWIWSRIQRAFGRRGR